MQSKPAKAAEAGDGARAHPHEWVAAMLSMLGKRTAEGKPVYTHGIERIADTADPVDVLRNALSAQQPGNAVVVVSGPASNLATLLKFPYAPALIAERTRLLSALFSRATARDWP